METEIFKIYKTAGGNRYSKLKVWEVSNLGRVKCNGEIVEPYLSSSGYLYIAHFIIHRAVAELFIPNPENKPCVDHINTDRLDNRAENLRWVTHKENCNNPLTKKHYSEASRGRVLSVECKRKMSEAQKGRTLSEETKRKISETLKGKPNNFKGKTHTEEAKRKISEAKKGKPNGRKGKHHSEETKRKMSEAKNGKHWYYDNDLKRRVFYD